MPRSPQILLADASVWGSMRTPVQAIVTEWDNNSHLLRRAAAAINPHSLTPKPDGSEVWGQDLCCMCWWRQWRAAGDRNSIDVPWPCPHIYFPQHSGEVVKEWWARECVEGMKDATGGGVYWFFHSAIRQSKDALCCSRIGFMQTTDLAIDPLP